MDGSAAVVSIMKVCVASITMGAMRNDTEPHTGGDVVFVRKVT